VPRRVCGRRREEITAELRRLHNEQLHSVYSSPDIHHHHVANKELGHLLTRSGLTHPEISSVVFLDSFCPLGCSFVSIWVICYVAFDLYVVSIFSCSPVFLSKTVVTSNYFAVSVFIL
jgi:hypothetical protein